MKENKNKVIAATTIVAAILVICLIVYLNKKQQVPKQNNISMTVTPIDDEEFFANIEEEAEEQFEEHYDLVERFLETYNIRSCGAELLYTQNDEYIDACQWLYKDEGEKAEKFHESPIQIEAKQGTYIAYETGIVFETYKKELLKIMSEEIFDKYFTEYAKDVDGMLYITNEATNNTITLESLEVIEENKYNLTYKQEEQERETTVTIDIENGKITEINL